MRANVQHLPRVSAADPGKKLDFVAAKLSEQYPGQCRPYCAFGCDMTQPFEGTLFRFPLRTPAQGAASKLSKQVGAAQLFPKFRVLQESVGLQPSSTRVLHYFALSASVTVPSERNHAAAQISTGQQHVGLV
jgi:hypothetical protein